MNLSKFFIDRPIFAGVISVLIFVAGLLALRAMPISEYPEVVPPSVVVRAQYPGANPKVIAETVATPIEQQINGVEGMLYMGSQATTDGLMTLTVTFKLGTDPDKAQQLVQNRVSQAEARLPEEVRRLGITTVKSSPDLTMVVHLLSPNNRYDTTYLRNYALLNVKDRLARIAGVGDVQLFGGGDYSMRVWLDPQKVAERGLSASDIIKEIQAQNVQAAAGVVGASPNLPGIDLQLSVNAQGRLQNEEDFGDIVVKTGANGEITRLRDIARIELGASQYSLRSLLDNKAAAAIGIFQAPGSTRHLGQRLRRWSSSRRTCLRGSSSRRYSRSIEAVGNAAQRSRWSWVVIRSADLACFDHRLGPDSIIGTFAVMYVFDFRSIAQPLRAGAGGRVTSTRSSS